MHHWVVTLAAVAMLVVMGCARPSEVLVPSGAVTVYDHPEGGAAVGVAEAPMKIEGYAYPDKTDYVVKVCFKGRIGYVREGARSIRKVAADRLSQCNG
ncbi:MAG: hypothetical protein RSA54_11915 [Glutamicibacter sp.]|uniref:hypothetical protein n=1 Tax=Stenotrophomonas sp. TaxID=69392 RepID=UPI002FCA9EB9